MNALNDKSIIFFDGVCNLCNQFVDFVIRHDRDNQFQFAPLQGSTAQRVLPPELRQNLTSLVLVHHGNTYVESAAALNVLNSLNGAPHLIGKIGLLLPQAMSDVFYRLTAKNRYRLFGKRETCRVPSPQERAKFLD